MTIGRMELVSESGTQVIYDADASTPKKSAASPSAIMRNFGEIKPEALKWLWPGRIPLGKLTLLIGDPGLGKSLVTIDIAARISRGSDFPDGERGEAGDVIFLSAEDDAADTIRPRLDAAGADVARVHMLEGMLITLADNSTAERAFNLETGMATLEDALGRIPAVRLIIIDPISAYLGGTDSNTNAEVRSLLSPLAALAAKYEVAVLCVTHLRKSAGAAVHRAIASVAFTVAARAVWAVASDPSDPERRMMLAVKQNLGPNVGGLAFRVAAQKALPLLEWEAGTISLNANDVLSAVEDRECRSARGEAEAWLTELLADDAVPVQKIRAEAKEAGFSWMTVRRAKESLSVLTEKSSYRAGWNWRFKTSQREDAHSPCEKLSAFEQARETTGNNSHCKPEDAQETITSIFDRGQL